MHIVGANIMGGNRDFSVEGQTKAVTLREEGYSLCHISSVLGRSVSGVQKVIDYYKANGKIKPCRIVQEPKKL